MRSLWAGGERGVKEEGRCADSSLFSAAPSRIDRATTAKLLTSDPAIPPRIVSPARLARQSLWGLRNTEIPQANMLVSQLCVHPVKSCKAISATSVLVEPQGA